jgi:hypothetical protein
MKIHNPSCIPKCRSLIFGLLVILFPQVRAQSSTDMSETSSTITRLLQSPLFPQQDETQKIATSLISKHGRHAAASMIVDFARAQTADRSQLYAARLIGGCIQPEFQTSVVSALSMNGEAQSAGRLLLLLRLADIGVVPSVLELLHDKRIAEQLSDRSEAEGASPFRVCDVAHNVIQEIRAMDKSQALSLTRDSDLTKRDHFIAKLYAELVPTSKPIAPREASKVESPNAPASLPPAEVKVPEAKLAPTPSDEPTSSTPWSIIIALILAATSLMWLLLKRRS